MQQPPITTRVCITLISALGVIILDRSTKYCGANLHRCGAALSPLFHEHDLFSLNTHGVFSFDIQNWAFLFACGALVALLFLFKKKPTYWWVAYGALLGGALSNGWDRLQYGGVIDWIPLGISVANIADIAIAGALVAFAVMALLEQSSE